MNLDVVEITSGLDQVLPIGDAKKKVFHRIDEAIQKAFEQDDMEVVWSAGRNLSEWAKLSGLGLAKLMYDGLQIWLRMEKGSESDYYEEAYIQMGKHRATVTRYTAIWAMLSDGIVPKGYREKLMLHGVKMLIPIAQAVKDGYEIPREKWLALANAVDGHEVRKIVKEITGKADNSNYKTRQIDAEGDYTMWFKGKAYYIAHFNISDDPVIQAEISRAINLLGVLEK